MPRTDRAEQDRSARGQAYGERDREQQRAQQREQDRRADDVEGALEREVDALEDGRRELEQRHRLTGDELGAVDQDLHRRGREPHTHAAPVALVDQLDGVVLGEVGVGDDDLVDAALGEHALEVRERAERLDAVGRQRDRREVADDLDRRVRRVRERVRDVADVFAAADEHGAALIAGGPQQRGGHLFVDARAARRRRSSAKASEP